MKIFCCFTIALLASGLSAAAPQASAPGTVVGRATPSPSPTPTPALKPPQRAAPAANQPKAVPGVSNTTAPGTVPGVPMAVQPAGGGSANVAELLRGMQFVRVLEQKNPNLGTKGLDPATLAILTQQKQAGDLRRNAIMASKSLAGSSGNVSANRKPGPPGSQGTTSLGNPNVVPPQSTAFDPEFCAHAYPRPIIVTIDSVKKGIVFIPDPNYNPYVFEGCNFGDATGSLYLTGGFAHGKVPLVIESWSDTTIVARVPADVTGELDQNDVQVKLIKAESKYYDSFSGYKFSALREEQFVSATNAQFSPADPFQPCGDNTNSPLSVCKYETPGYDIPRLPFQSGSPTLGILRISKYGSQNSLAGRKGTDTFTLSSLRPEFAISRIALGAGPFIGAPVWSAKINNRTIEIGFEFDPNRNSAATYYMDIWVVGPKGVHW